MLNDSLFSIWTHVATSSSLQLFLLSSLALVLGLGVVVWQRAVRLSQLDAVPLNVVERRHPHIPSFQIILSFLFSYLGIMLAAMLLARWHGVRPFTGAYQWLQLAGIIALLGSVSILGELAYRRSRPVAAVTIVVVIVTLVTLTSTRLVQGYLL